MDLRTAQRQLQAAQCEADVESLDALLHPQVVGAARTERSSQRKTTWGATAGVRCESPAWWSSRSKSRRTGMTRTVAAVDAVQGRRRIRAAVLHPAAQDGIAARCGPPGCSTWVSLPRPPACTPSAAVPGRHWQVVLHLS